MGAAQGGPVLLPMGFLKQTWRRLLPEHDTAPGGPGILGARGCGSREPLLTAPYRTHTSHHPSPYRLLPMNPQQKPERRTLGLVPRGTQDFSEVQTQASVRGAGADPCTCWGSTLGAPDMGSEGSSRTVQCLGVREPVAQKAIQKPGEWPMVWLGPMPG